MEALRRAVIANIVSAATVHSPAGWEQHIKNRKTYGIAFCLEGKSRYTRNDGAEVISDRAHGMLLPQGGSYTVTALRPGDFALINFRSATPLYDAPCAIAIADPEGCWELFEKIKRLSVLDGSRMKQLALFYELLDHLFVSRADGGILDPALRYLQNHLEDPTLCNGDLARECGVSEVYLRRLFARRLGTTPKQYILRLRMNLARQLLAEGILKISAVAERCGFSNAYHFSRAFRQAMGVTPTDYAAQNRDLDG